jgi:dTDP-4-amino-4,6-dideoxygalactose transaminase
MRIERLLEFSREMAKDTVEEFWDPAALTLCLDRISDCDPDDSVRGFAAALQRFLNTQNPVSFAVRATTGLRDLLRSNAVVGKTSVLVASFNCSLVADAVRRSGLEVETFDLSDRRGGMDWESVASRLHERHLAIVIPHLFGVPTDFRPLCPRARALSVLVIEDCAHTLGGRIGEKQAGTLGDAAVFSFNYDKPISLGGGGVVLVNSPRVVAPHPVVAPGIEAEWGELIAFQAWLQQRRRGIMGRQTVTKRILRRAFEVGRSVASRLHVAPRRHRDPFAMSGLGPLRATLGLWLLTRYPGVAAIRTARANRYADGFPIWYVGATVTPAYIKQKLVFDSASATAEICTLLRQAGLRIGNVNWPVTIDAYLGREPQTNSRHVAACGIDVPVHQNLTEAECEVIYELLSGLLTAVPSRLRMEGAR